MNKAWIAGLTAALALAGCGRKETGPEEEALASAPAVAPPVPAATADPAAAKPLASFVGMDGDGDGKVTSVEYAKATQTMFQMMDGDTDGAVTVAEMDAAREAMDSATAQSSEKKIAALDTDGDGMLTLAEYVAGSNAFFAQVDGNKDDAIDQAEWARRYAVASPTPAPVSAPAAKQP